MLMSQQYPTQHLKHADLAGQTITLTIQAVEMVKVGDDQKPIVKFYETQQDLVLNKTNAAIIIPVYGDESAAWTGRQITLCTVQTQMGPGIGVQIPAAAAAPVVGAVAPAVATPVLGTPVVGIAPPAALAPGVAPNVAALPVGDAPVPVGAPAAVPAPIGVPVGVPVGGVPQ